jgi:hypothetical protein
MFDSSVIDVAIGLVFVFLLLSFIASAVKEGLEALFKRRATDLENGIKELLGTDEIGKTFIESLYNHGLINSLFAGKYNAPKVQLPSYIPSKNFALALMDLRNQSQSQSQSQSEGAAPRVSLPQNVKQAFDAFEITAGKDADKMQKHVEDWYNSSMDRVSGWYKRRTQWWLFGIGILITLAVNVDCITIANRLSTDKTLREAVVQSAQEQARSNPALATVTSQTSSTAQGKVASDTDDSIRKIKVNLSALDGIGLPLGWKEDLKEWHIEKDRAENETVDDKKSSALRDAYWNLIFSHIPGWLLTALAVSLGAPFWFDMLNKIMVVRSTVKPSEKSKEEGSKDPAPAKSNTQSAQQTAVR